MAINTSTYTGRALKYPIEVDGVGNVVTVTGKQSIEQSIKKILSTPIGSMFFRRDYGSRLSLLLFEPNDAVLMALLRFHIWDALNKFEKRIIYLRTEFSFTPDSVHCIIIYRMTAVNKEESFIYPFYRNLTQ